MGNAKDQLVTDVCFIFDEAVRIQQLAKTGKLRDIPQTDLWGQLPHPSGNGFLMCGMEAHARLSELADMSIQRAGLTGRVAPQGATKKLGEVLVRRFLVEDQSIDISHVERSLSEVGKWLHKSTEDITHIIPCNLMLSKIPTEFSIGPVTFFQREAFRTRLANSVLDARRGDTVWNRKILSETIRYYSKFGWVGEVRISGCDRPSSERIAEDTIRSAVNCLGLVFGAQYSDRMEIGGPSRSWERSGKLQHSSSGQLWYSGTASGPGQVGYGEDWSELWQNEDIQHNVQLYGTALAIHIDPRSNSAIANRFLDAATWYGEAIREQNAGAKVVKLVTSVERLFMTNERDNIADLVSDRVAGFRMHAFTDQNFKTLRRETKGYYDLRSRLVHGALASTDGEVVRKSHSASEWARLSLLSGLTAFGPMDGGEGQVPIKKLAGWYETIVAKHRPTGDIA